MATALRKVVLVGGSGRLGPHILKALQADPAFDVTVVSRQSSTATFPPNTNVIKVSDAYTKDDFVQAFTGHDVAVLSLNLAIEAQYHNMLVDASIEAGVKRLIPSIWAARLDIPEACDVFPVSATKARLLEYVKSKVGSAPGWSYTAVACGLFHDLCVQTGFYGLDQKTHSATIWDQGDNKFSVTTMDTVGLTVPKILRKPEATANRTVYISGFETSMNELLAAYKLGTGVEDWNLDHDSVDQCIETSKEKFKTAETFMDRMRAVRPLGLLVGVKTGLGGDFVAEGISDNELLEVPRSDVFETTAKLLKQ